jgi:hypothetical protein
VAEKLKEVHGRTAAVGSIANTDRSASGADRGIGHVLLEPKNPVRRNQAILIGKEDETAAGFGDAPIAGRSGRQALRRLDQFDAGKAPADDLGRGVTGTFDNDDLAAAACRRAPDGLQAVGDGRCPSVGWHDDRDINVRQLNLE